MHQTIEEGSGRQDNRLGTKYQTDLCFRTDYQIPVQNQIFYCLLKDQQIFLFLQNHPDRPAIEGTISLSARSADSRSFRPI